MITLSPHRKIQPTNQKGTASFQHCLLLIGLTQAALHSLGYFAALDAVFYHLGAADLQDGFFDPTGLPSVLIFAAVPGLAVY
jgi:hypothetical protein